MMWKNNQEEKKITIESADKTLSRVMSTSRIWALISIVCAHISFGTSFDVAFSRYGNIGVVVFLIISGYYYRSEKYATMNQMLKNKFKTVVIPWFSVGSFVFFVGELNARRIPSFSTYLSYILGNRSYLYYLTVLMLLFIIFRPFGNNKTFLLLAIGINVASQLLTAFKILDSVIEAIGITHYLNIFNWCGFFAIGQLLRMYSSEKVLNLFKHISSFCSLGFIIIFIFACIKRDVSIGYFGKFGLIYELIGASGVFSLSFIMPITNNKLFLRLSNDSFSIYLIHYIVYAVIDVLISHSIVLIYIAPLIVIFVAFCLLEVCALLCKSITRKNIFNLIVGMRSV